MGIQSPWCSSSCLIFPGRLLCTAQLNIPRTPWSLVPPLAPLVQPKGCFPYERLTTFLLLDQFYSTEMDLGQKTDHAIFFFCCFRLQTFIRKQEITRNLRSAAYEEHIHFNSPLMMSLQLLFLNTYCFSQSTKQWGTALGQVCALARKAL